jgi:hypothetical protein
MAEIKIFDVDAKPVQVNLGPSRIKFSYHGNQFIVVWQLKPYLCDTGSHNWAHCTIIVTAACYVTMEAEVCSLL